MPKPALFYVAADELPDLSFEFEGVDLSTLSSITLRIKRSDGKLVTATGIVDDAAAGKGHFEFATGDLIEGTHEMEIRTIRLADSKPRTFPSGESIQFIVRGQV